MPTSKASSSSCCYRRVRAIIVEVVVADVCSPTTIETMLILVVAAATLLSKTHTLEQKLQHQNRVSFCDGPFRQRLILRTRQKSNVTGMSRPDQPIFLHTFIISSSLLCFFISISIISYSLDDNSDDDQCHSCSRCRLNKPAQHLSTPDAAVHDRRVFSRGKRLMSYSRATTAQSMFHEGNAVA